MEPPSISVVGISTWPGCFSSLIRDRRNRPACRPISSARTSIVAICGENSSAISSPSKPVTERSDGTSRPRSRACRMAPMARTSLAQITAVTSGYRSRIDARASRPSPMENRVLTMASAGTETSSSASADRAPSRRRRARSLRWVCPAMMPKRRCPRSRRCRVSSAAALLLSLSLQ